MRGLLAGTVVVLLGFTAPAAAQDATVPPLERIIDTHGIGASPGKAR